MKYRHEGIRNIFPNHIQDARDRTRRERTKKLRDQSPILKVLAEREYDQSFWSVVRTTPMTLPEQWDIVQAIRSVHSDKMQPIDALAQSAIDIRQHLVHGGLPDQAESWIKIADQIEEILVDVTFSGLDTQT